MAAGGSYCLCLRVARALSLRVGSLGVVSFPPGRYIYVGSALRGLEMRLKRHIELNMGRRSNTFWHIDYLLRDPNIEIEAIFIRFSEKRIECEVADSVSRMGRAVVGFGCSDCRCISHLFQVDDFTSLSGLGFSLWFDGAKRLRGNESIISSY